ncbi:PilZ domain-containing protein [Catenovulum agarivorans]|uniref:PilZ domain-containing protein n=1 Tax=Catenovulum agarivorans TaxID=1172192 RepID=UPI0012F8BA87|nr:PilZ domain-containing protein [Catenovulum agarivorans]
MMYIHTSQINQRVELLYQNGLDLTAALQLSQSQLHADSTDTAIHVNQFLLRNESIHNELAFHQARFHLYVWLCIASLVLIPIMYWVSLHKPLYQRLDNLIARMDSIVRGDLSINHPKFPESDVGIIKQLDNSFSEMSLALAITISTLKRQLKHVSYSAEQVQDITKHQLSASESNMYDTGLLSSIAHDLVDSTEVVSLLLASFKFDLGDGYLAAYPDEKRQYDRLDIGIRVEVEQSHCFIDRMSNDFSVGGVNVYCRLDEVSRFDQDKILMVRLYLPKQIAHKYHIHDQLLEIPAKIGWRKLIDDRYEEVCFQYVINEHKNFAVLSDLFEYFAE